MGLIPPRAQKWDAIVLDLGNVVFEWSNKPLPGVVAKMSSIMATETYARYETGGIETDSEFYETVGQQLGIQPATVRSLFEAARSSLSVNDDLINFVETLKQEMGIAIYVMSNISQKEIAYLYSKHPNTMAVFDKVFTSGHAGVRKPGQQFFQTVIAESRLAPQRAIFVDDKMKNVEAARQAGFHALQFSETQKFICDLRDLLPT